jgi:hypothetical protein
MRSSSGTLRAADRVRSPVRSADGAVAGTVSGEPARLRLVFVREDCVLPEPGRLLHAGGSTDPVDPVAVQAHWLPYVPTGEDAAMLGLELRAKPAVLEALDQGLAHLVSGLSWASWMSTEEGRPQPELANRVGGTDRV